MEPEKIVLVELESELPNFGQLIAMHRHGIGVIGSVLDGAGYDVRLLSDAYGRVTIDEIIEESPDIVMFGGIKTSMNRVKKLSDEVRRNLDVPIIFGGEEATISPENVQNHADYVVLYEGDQTVLKLVNALKSGKEPSKVSGIKYKNSEMGWIETSKPRRVKKIQYYLNPEIFRGLKDFGRKTRLARWLNLSSSLSHIRFPIQTSRGCDYSCKFCSKNALYSGPGYFERSIDDVIDEIDRVMEYTGITKFSMVDNIFGGSKEYIDSFLEEIISHYTGRNPKPTFSSMMRADQFDEERLGDVDIFLMKRAGFEYICIGMESINQGTLDEIHKDEEVGQYVIANRRLRKHGIQVVGTFGVGGEDDKKEDINAAVEFARINYMRQVHLYAFSITPGTEEYEENKHQVIPSIEDKYWNGHAVTIFPKNMLPTELQEGILDAMQSFYPLTTPLGLFYRRMIKKIRKSLTGHMAFLKEREAELISDEIYERKNGIWVLNEEKLINRIN